MDQPKENDIKNKQRENVKVKFAVLRMVQLFVPNQQLKAKSVKAFYKL